VLLVVGGYEDIKGNCSEGQLLCEAPWNARNTWTQIGPLPRLLHDVLKSGAILISRLEF
jgi:hypothetical protein